MSHLDFWPESGYAQLVRDDRGWLRPGDDYLRLFLALVATQTPPPMATTNSPTLTVLR
ncbi:MAG: hypothetical protein Q8M01_04405 [Rubrivivax sp.]|nr:hypothetical protein [Rubrivivax sp.]